MGAFARVILGYRSLGTTLVDEWAQHTKTVGGHFYDEDYTTEVAWQDAVKGTRLTLRSWFLVVNEAVEAVAIMAKDPSNRPEEQLESFPSNSPLTGAALALEGDLVGRDNEQNAIPKLSVAVVPDVLDAGQVSFKVTVPRGAWPPDVYVGRVTAVAPNKPPAHVVVSILVP
jgi:hypothetical protein